MKMLRTENRRRNREAILLRYFENQLFAEVSPKLGHNENATRMRVARALEHFHSLCRLDKAGARGWQSQGQESDPSGGASGILQLPEQGKRPCALSGFCGFGVAVVRQRLREGAVRTRSHWSGSARSGRRSNGGARGSSVRDCDGGGVAEPARVER